MATQTITLELPESIYRTARQIAEATNRPIEEIMQESLSHALPPLDDMEADEGHVLANMSTLDDIALWKVADEALSSEEQTQLQILLDRQSAGELSETESVQLQQLMDGYGRLLVRKSHAWLLLARRGYRVPVQTQ